MKCGFENCEMKARHLLTTQYNLIKIETPLCEAHTQEIELTDYVKHSLDTI